MDMLDPSDPTNLVNPSSLVNQVDLVEEEEPMVMIFTQKIEILFWILSMAMMTLLGYVFLTVQHK
jgi:hypothetical protein